MDERIAAYLAQTGLAALPPRIVPLTGDASDRRYFRVLLSDGNTMVLALHGSPIDFATLPFANVARLLERMSIPAPRVLGHSDQLGVIALEDLGDVTLQAHLGTASVSEHTGLYRQAVELIAQLQQRGAGFTGADYVPYRQSFDVEKLTWELDFFVRHFLDAFRGVALSSAERAALAEEWTAIAGELASEPRVLCHRDYHSRNLMLHLGRLYLIDFQDARMGPDTYDLVSLLRDSYVDITASELEMLVAHFLSLTEPTDATEFERRFDLMSVQRNLKALGTFGYQATTRANPVYIQYMPRTLRYVRRNLARYDRFARLRGVLAQHVEELR